MAEQEALEAHYRARSLWLDGIPEPLTPRLGLGADADCDVAIVGAGFTGLWTAYYLKQHQPGLRVVVVEREIAGYGPSGRNGGAVGPGFPGSFAAYGIRDGDESVLRAIREAKAVVDEVGRVIADEGIECGYLKAGGLVVAARAGNHVGARAGEGQRGAPADSPGPPRAGPHSGGARVEILTPRGPSRSGATGARARERVRAPGGHDPRAHRGA